MTSRTIAVAIAASAVFALGTSPALTQLKLGKPQAQPSSTDFKNTINPSPIGGGKPPIATGKSTNFIERGNGEADGPSIPPKQPPVKK